MREYHVLKTEGHYPDTTTYMEALSGENAEEQFKEMDDKIQSIMGKGQMGDCFKEASC